MYKFLDLFAGIGGFHLALESAGCACAGAVEIDNKARTTYKTNFNINDNIFFKDIKDVDVKDIPKFNILCAGFPCQPFSVIGKSMGFKDARGTLFYEILRILEHSAPEAILLENVRGLLRHDNSRTFKIIKESLEALNYTIHYRVLNAIHYGCPQNRERLFIVGFKNDTTPFQFPMTRPLTTSLSDILGGNCPKHLAHTIRVGGVGSPYGDRHNWDGYEVNGVNRRITVEEAKILQGFPSNFIIPVSRTQGLKQLGNAVNVGVASAVAQKLVNHLKNRD